MDTEINAAPSTSEAAQQQRKAGMRPVAFTLQAGVPAPFGISGDWFHTLDAPMSDLYVRFDDGEAVPAREGVGLRRYYSKVTLVSATGGAVVCLAGYGSVTDARATANVDVTANVAPGNTFNNGGDVSVPDRVVTQLLAADPDRLYASIDLPSDAIGAIRVGTATVGAASGRLIEPGMSVPIATTAALYAYHENGSAVTVAASSVKQV